MIVHVGDTAPSLLIDTNADLTGASVKTAHVRRFHQDTVVDFPLTTLGDPTEGVLEYVWQAGDTDTPGTHAVEAEVTFSNGKVETFPQGSYLELLILP